MLLPPPPPCQPSSGLTQLRCPASPQVFQSGTCVSASVRRQDYHPMDSVSVAQAPAPFSRVPFSFPSLARKLSGTQEIRHSLGSLLVIILHIHSTGAWSTHTHGVSCNSSSYPAGLVHVITSDSRDSALSSLHSLLTHSPESKVHRKRHCHISRGSRTATCFRIAPISPNPQTSLSMQDALDSIWHHDQIQPL